MLKSELEKLKQEKESNKLQIENFDNASKSLEKLIRSQIPNKSRKGLGFVRYNVVSPPPIGLFSPPNLDLSNSGLEEFQQPEFEGYGPKTSKNVSEDTSNEVRESPDALMVEKLVSNDKSQSPRGNQRNWNNQKSQQLGSDFVRLGHVNFKTINKLVKENFRRGLPSKRFENDQTCVACLKGKQHNASCKSKIQNSITQPLFMLHMDLFSLTFVSSLMNKKYYLVVTDDYSGFTWVFFLASKDETSGILKSFITKVENLVDKKVKIIKCDNGTKFKNRVMSDFCIKKGIKREFSIARTPQQNGVAERRNRTLIEAARTMLADSKLPTTFWAEVVNTSCYVQNRVLVVKPHNKTLYELFRGRTLALSFMRPFRCHVTILNTLDYLGKFDGKSDEGFFLRYSLNSKAFRVYNIRTRKVEENLHIRFLEDKPIILGDGPKWLFNIDVLIKSINYVPVVAGTNSNDFVGTEESVGTVYSSKETGSSQDYILMPLWKDGSLFGSSLKNASNDEPQPFSDAGKKDDEGSKYINTVSPTVTTAPLEATHADFFGDETKLDMSNITNTYLVPSIPNTRIHKDHLLDHMISDVQSGVQTRRMTKTSNEQSRTQEGDSSFDRSKLDRSNAVYRNKKDKRVARIEAIRIFLAYASFKDFVVYQMDVKSAFLYGKIEEEVYVYQPPRFEDPEFPDRVYKVEKALYVLHQAPRAWYETLSTYLLDNGFQRGQIDKTLFIKRFKGDILLVQVYVDDIIFGSIRNEMCNGFEKMMHKKFQLSSMGELTFFLGLQTASTPIETSKSLLKDAEAEDVDVHLYRSMIGSLMYLTASRPDIMFVVCACARFQVTPKVSHHHAVKRIFRYLKGQPKLGLWYPKGSPFNLEAYTDNDYAGASLDKKSTTGGCQFLRSRLISWQCKKQTIVANSTTEAKYVAATSCCGQVLWIQNQMLDYGYNFMNTKIFIDNESTICIVKNLVFHSKTKHIEIRHHFIRDSNEKKLIQMTKIYTDQNVADLFTKAFDVGRFQYLIATVDDAIQFWQTATASTLDNGEMEITATIDGKIKIVTEASIRRHLKLEDSDGISNLPTTEIFEQLALMGQETKVPQHSSPLHTNVADEAASTGVDVRYGGAATTVTGLEA
ncbi:putative ribonuclease H-like domain-containing protein [Tanacetum coccineum]